MTCVTLQSMLRTHQGVASAPNRQDEVGAIVSEPVGWVADENCRHFLRDAKKQRDLLKDLFYYFGRLAVQEKRI